MLGVVRGGGAGGISVVSGAEGAAEIAALQKRVAALEAANAALVDDKSALEARCKTMVRSIAQAEEDHEAAVEAVQAKMDQVVKEKDAELGRNTAMMANKIAKISEDMETTLGMIKMELDQADAERADLLHLSGGKKLVWIPDKLVAVCMRDGCGQKFAANHRRHHCRCCGRVFCSSCVKNKAPLPIFGYDKPVPLCASCLQLNSTYTGGADD